MAFRGGTAVEIKSGGVLVARRQALNFVGFGVADDAVNREVDISGGGVMAATVAGLGAGVDGKTGILKAGATPFRFMPVVYEATLGKWISEESWQDGSWATISTPVNDTTMTELASRSTFHNYLSYHWNDYDVAGMRPQIRCCFEYWNPASSFSNYSFGWRGRNLGTAGWSGITSLVSSISAHNVTSPDAIDTGWLEPGIGTIYNQIQAVLSSSTSLDVGGQCHMRQVKYGIRFVSK